MTNTSKLKPNQRFGRLLLEQYVGGRRWACRCDCGARHVAAGYDIKAGKTRSCGCLRREVVAASRTVHGHKRVGRQSPEYAAWCNMWTRCTNPRQQGWSNYGGRGITVCKRWRKFENFIADMGPKPGKHVSLERVDNAKDYMPGNCVWATRQEQARNTRRAVLVEGKSLHWWAKALGVTYSALVQRRLKYGTIHLPTKKRTQNPQWRRQ